MDYGKLGDSLLFNVYKLEEIYLAHIKKKWGEINVKRLENGVVISRHIGCPEGINGSIFLFIYCT